MRLIEKQIREDDMKMKVLSDRSVGKILVGCLTKRCMNIILITNMLLRYMHKTKTMTSWRNNFSSRVFANFEG